MHKKTIELPEHIVACIIETAKRFPEIEEVVIFGSWALGNAKRGSDIDLAVSGRNVTSKIVASFQYFLEEETEIPHFFDVVHMETVCNDALKEHIVDKGITIYVKRPRDK